MKKLMFVMILALLAITLLAGGSETERQAVVAVIESAYLNGIQNVGDVAAIQAGFHPEFALLGLENGQLWKLPIAEWIARVEKKKAEGKYPPAEKISFKYPLIDITGPAAMVKIDFFLGDRQIFTDYLLLYKFADGWKLVSKIYADHRTKG